MKINDGKLIKGHFEYVFDNLAYIYSQRILDFVDDLMRFFKKYKYVTTKQFQYLSNVAEMIRGVK